MSRKAVYLGDVDEALSLIEFAQVRADRVSATGQAMMAAIRARLLALLDRHEEARAEVDRADHRFADRDPAADPPWLCHYDHAEHQGSTGRALIPVARTKKRLRHHHNHRIPYLGRHPRTPLDLLCHQEIQQQPSRHNGSTAPNSLPTRRHTPPMVLARLLNAQPAGDSLWAGPGAMSCRPAMARSRERVEVVVRTS
jgi:hypothetical protein